MGYTLILMAMEKERNLQDMVDLLGFMRLIGSPPNEVSYGVTINTASHLSDGVFAKNLLQDMILHGISPSPPCYSGVLMACAKANMWDEVQRLLEAMLRQGNEVSEGMLIGLLFQIKSKVQSIKDNVTSTGIQEPIKASQLINELWGKAWWLLDQFLSRATNLTDYIFVVAMEVADVCDRPYDVYHVFNLMKVYNIPVGKAARQWLEQACLRTRDHNLALHIVHDPHFNDVRTLNSNRWTALRRMTERFSHREYVDFMGFNQTRLFDMAGIYSRVHPSVGEYLHFNAHLMELLHRHDEESLVQLLFLQSMHRYLHPRDWLGEDKVAMSDEQQVSNASWLIQVTTEEAQENSTNQSRSEWSVYSWYLTQTKRTLSSPSWVAHGYRCAALGFLRDGYPGYALALKDWMRQHQVEDIITNRLILLTLLRSPPPPPFLSKIFELIENDALMSKDPMALVLGIEAALHLAPSSPDIYETAIVYLRNLSSLGYPMTTEILNKVIAVCVECRRPEEAKRLMQTMEVFDIPRDNVTYHLVVESLIQANLWDDAQALMQSTIQNADQFPLEPWVRSLYANTTYADLFESEFTVYRDSLSSTDLASNEKLWKESRSSTKAKLPPAKGFGRKPSPKPAAHTNTDDSKSHVVESQDIQTVTGNELWTTKDWDVAIRRHISSQDKQRQSLDDLPATPHPRKLYFQSLVDSLRAQKRYDHVDTLAAI
eukprot:gene5241-3747_t